MSSASECFFLSDIAALNGCEEISISFESEIIHLMFESLRKHFSPVGAPYETRAGDQSQDREADRRSRCRLTQEEGEQPDKNVCNLPLEYSRETFRDVPRWFTGFSQDCLLTLN